MWSRWKILKAIHVIHDAGVEYFDVDSTSIIIKKSLSEAGTQSEEVRRPIPLITNFEYVVPDHVCERDPKTIIPFKVAKRKRYDYDHLYELTIKLELWVSCECFVSHVSVA